MIKTNSETPIESKLIYVGSITRSGSTWLFNAIKNILLSNYNEDDCQFGWIDDVKILNSKKITLIKTHDIKDIEFAKKPIVFTSKRDPASTALSMIRMGWLDKNINDVLGWVDYCISQIRTWEAAAIYCVDYENITKSPETIIAEIAKILDIKISQKQIISIAQELEKLPNYIPSSDNYYNKNTLMHAKHRSVAMDYLEIEYLRPIINEHIRGKK